MDTLSDDVVAFLMRAIIDERLPLSVACDLISPWVSGSEAADPWAEWGAQDIHGFDQLTDGSGLVSHAETPTDDNDYLFSRDHVVTKCNEWLRRYASGPDRR